MINKGYYYEKILLRSLQYNKSKYSSCYFIKSPTPYLNLNENEGFYSGIALNDYVGIFNTKFILIELKTIHKDFFYKNILKKSQEETLTKIKKNKGFSFIVIVFAKTKKIYLIDIDSWISIKTKKISIEIIEKDEKFILVKWLNPWNIDILNTISNILSNIT